MALDHSVSYSNRIGRTYHLSGYRVEIVAPEGVSMFDVQSIALDLVETENSGVKFPINIHLEASVS